MEQMTDCPDQPSAALFASLADRYRMVRELGRGGMATVFLAEDLKHHRPVAIKVMRPELSASASAYRFLREIEVAARLQHPHIVPLFDSGICDGLLYYVMSYEAGESLRDRLEQEKQLAVQDALRITRQVADALAHAHDLGIVHRDVKPSNILFSSGHAMLADFGIARALLTSTGEVSTTGIAVGTPTYMSPEQSLAERDLDGRSDIYSAACVLFEMLAGVPPFTGPNAQAILAAHRSIPPPSVRLYRPAIPESVEQTLSRALAKSPADRFRTAAEFRDMLERVEITIASDSIARLPPPQWTSGLHSTPVPPTRRSWWRHPRWIAALTAAAVAIAVVLMAVGSQAIRSWRPNWMLTLHPKRILIFPLHPRLGLAAAGANDIGESASLLIGYRLASTPGMEFVDASEYLAGDERTGAAELTIARKRELSRALHADYLLDGSIDASGTSAVTVVLRLRGVEDTISILKGADGPRSLTEIPLIALAALRKLLPAFLEPGQRVDQSAFEMRDPAAIVAFLEGERLYRDSRFAEALARYELAIEHDSLLAVAALKAAQAASWLSMPSEASRFSDIAVREVGLLPAKYATYARALQLYLRGEGNAALTVVRPLVTDDPQWTDAWFLLGETYYHLMPSDVRADSLDVLADSAFRMALWLDPQFTPAVDHLLDLAVRHGNVPRVDSLAPVLKRTLSDSGVKWLDAVTKCMRDGAESIDPRSLAGAGASGGWNWGETLVFDPARGGCARSAFRFTLSSPQAARNDLWGAIVGINASLIAAGRDEEAARFVTSPALDSLRGWALLFVDAAGGANVQNYTKRKADSLGTAFNELPSAQLWLLASWYSLKRDVPALREITHTLDANRDKSHKRLDSLFAAVSSAHLAVALADTAAAVRELRALEPRATLDELVWQPWEAFAGERMLLARLLEARGERVESIRVASQLDAPVAMVNLIYLRQSLILRERASVFLGDGVGAARYRQRLAQWTDDRAPFP